MGILGIFTHIRRLLGDLQLPAEILRILPQLQGMMTAARVMTPGGYQAFGGLRGEGLGAGIGKMSGKCLEN
jgi:hypothetical protein